MSTNKRVRVFRIAQELGVSPEVLISRCQDRGYHFVSNPHSMLPLKLAAQVRDWYAGDSSDGDALEYVSAGGRKRRRGNVFISYRRSSGSQTARLVQQHLTSVGFRVFLDVHNLAETAFDEQLLVQISDSACVLLILSVGSLDRCIDPEDWVRRELLHADREHKPIVTLRMPDFRFPNVEHLPDAIARINRLNSIEYSHTYFDAAMMRLESALANYCKRNKSYELGSFGQKSDEQSGEREPPMTRDLKS